MRKRARGGWGRMRTVNAKDDIIEKGELIENENFIGADEHADSIQNVMIQNGKGISSTVTRA